jgi:Tol biopolymer transport system component
VGRDQGREPDRARLALSPQGIYLMNADGTDIRQITNDGSPAWSPDGQSIVFAAAAGEGTTSTRSRSTVGTSID